jgi:6-pyruvoyltetrahydropterin/6-carboxytetrahydropterin synthase
MSWTAERYHDISCGHRVHNQGSKCELMHGHNYRVHFTCAADKGALDDVGRVIDFSDMKSRLCMWLEDNWDHKFLAWTEDPVMRTLTRAVETFGEELQILDSIVWVDFNPTAENMAEHLVRVIGPQQLAGTGIILTHCRIDETRKCSATFTAEG